MKGGTVWIKCLFKVKVVNFLLMFHWAVLVYLVLTYLTYLCTQILCKNESIKGSPISRFTCINGEQKIYTSRFPSLGISRLELENPRWNTYVGHWKLEFQYRDFFFHHLCDSRNMRFFSGNKKRINGELRYMLYVLMYYLHD